MTSDDLNLLNELYQNMNSIEPDAVVFNYECCQSLSSCGYRFPNEKVTMELTKLLIDRKSMVMFTHFSIMALVNCWDPNYLGTAPFVSIGTGNGNLLLKFDPNTLLECPSSQLQRVAQLCDGRCDVSGYTCYSVNQNIMGTHQDYNLEILTYITNEVGAINHHSMSDNLKCKFNGETAVPCHTLLKYPSGGVLLASNGHWLDISNLDVSVEKMLKIAEQTYGVEEYTKMRREISETTGLEQKSNLNKYAKKYVQESVPCKYSKQRN